MSAYLHYFIFYLATVYFHGVLIFIDLCVCEIRNSRVQWVEVACVKIEIVNNSANGPVVVKNEKLNIIIWRPYVM